MKSKNIKRLIFDADDTLWENNIHYINASEDLVKLISKLGLSKEKIESEFQILEKKVVREKGYGSMNYLHILRTLYERYVVKGENQKLNSDFERICDEFKNHLLRIFNHSPTSEYYR